MTVRLVASLGVPEGGTPGQVVVKSTSADFDVVWADPNTVGPAGPAGTITSATATALASGAAPTVALGGTPSARTIALGIPAGGQGVQGPAGTITDVTATGLAAGATPTVALGGTPSARTIALGIPQGTAGTPGTPGTPGAAGVVDYNALGVAPRIKSTAANSYPSRASRIAAINAVSATPYIAEVIYDATRYTSGVTAPTDPQVGDFWDYIEGSLA